MAKVIVVYESKYGNTKLGAETIVDRIETVLGELKEYLIFNYARFLTMS